MLNSDVSTLSNKEKLLERAYICLELKEWKKAQKLFEKVIVINPHSSRAYLGKCLIKFRVQNTHDLISKGKKILKNKYFRIAFKLSASEDCELNDTVFQIQNKEKLRKLKKNKRIKIISKIILALILLCFIIVTGIICYNKFIAPIIGYKRANKLLSNNEYNEAITLLEKNPDYKNSKDILLDAKYNYGLELYANNEFADCATVFNQIRSYKDSNSYLQKQEVFWRTKGNIITLGSYEQDNN